MANIVVPSTIVADTGTGITWVPYRLSGDLAMYTESAPVGVAATLVMKRVDPKPSGSYLGAGKAEIKMTRAWADPSGRNWPMVYTMTTSIPAGMSSALKYAFVTETVLLAGTAQSRDALAALMIPQA